MRALALLAPGLLACLVATGASADDAGVPDADASADGSAADGAVLDGSLAGLDLLPEDLRPTLSIELTPTGGTMTGDLVHLIVTAEAAASDDLTVPEQPFAPLELQNAAATTEPAGPDRTRHRFDLTLIAFEPGEHVVGPVRVRVLTADGTLGVALTEPVTVWVGSVLGNEPDAQPKPPTDPVSVLEEDYTLAWILGGLGGLAVLALLMFLAARWWLSRERPEPPPPPPRPAWETALLQLAELRRSLEAGLSSSAFVHWADRLSDAMRQYFGGRYGFDGLESTTDEVLAHIRKQPRRGLAVPEVTLLLGECDLVKFAKATPTAEDCERLLETAFRMVNDTTPLTTRGGLDADPEFAPEPAPGGQDTVPETEPTQDTIPETRQEPPTDGSTS